MNMSFQYTTTSYCFLTMEEHGRGGGARYHIVMATKYFQPTPKLVLGMFTHCIPNELGITENSSYFVLFQYVSL